MVSHRRSESGFSLIELLVATGLILVVSSIVTSALMQLTKHQQTIWNRTEMHSGIRGATELLQQEVGQAGRISVPVSVKLSQAISGVGGAAPAASATCDPANPGVNAVTVQVTSVSGLFTSNGAIPASYVLLSTLDGNSRESTPVWAINKAATPPTITACFTNPHNAGTVLAALGGFATGIVPPTGIPNGSTAHKLKLYGDITGDGNMVYVEYYCDNGDPGTDGSHNLYRNVMPFDAASKPAISNSMILLTNVYPNPPDAGGVARDCFQYQVTNPPLIAQGQPFTFVLDVAVTLTVQTEQIDPVTKQYQTETKALLNVSPRNVFSTWEMASAGYTDHIQSTPATVTALLP